jgi:hypothetical protein
MRSNARQYESNEAEAFVGLFKIRRKVPRNHTRKAEGGVRFLCRALYLDDDLLIWLRRRL